MESFAPEFAHFWLGGQTGGVAEAKRESRDAESDAQQAALEELAERVAAARSIF
jgi:hypothetical protein